MIVKNKKNGTNVLAYRTGIQNIRVIIRANEEVHIDDLEDFNQVINKQDFGHRGWFNIVEEKSEVEIANESKFERAQKEVKEYTLKEK